ncbi:hypothetical protein [Gemmatimonas sp.]|uniref:hypothetical protein n=1 Tax=Gemmatimonas sp. TaxID=1962908 RepID=UPI0035665E14
MSEAFLPAGTARVQLVLPTINWHDGVARVVRAAADACTRHQDVRLVVADGRGLEPLRDFVERLRREGGGDLRYLQATSLIDRFDRAVDPACDWTLFLTDDDAFTINYLDLLIEGTRDAANDVAIVAPTHCLVASGAELQKTRAAPTLRHSTAASRLHALYSARDANVSLYFAAHRTPAVRQWVDTLLRKGYTPSYYDQLLIAIGVAEGAVVPTTRVTVLVRDEHNWNHQDRVIETDARYYPHRGMVFCHELFWVGDVVRALGAHREGEALDPALVLLARELLPNVFALQERRCALLRLLPTAALQREFEMLAPFVLALLDEPASISHRRALSELTATAERLEQHFRNSPDLFVREVVA